MVNMHNSKEYEPAVTYVKHVLIKKTSKELKNLQ